LYTLIFALHPRSERDPRLLVMAALATMWGIRLTYNFWRRGGYSLKGEEDYRWGIVRSKLSNPILYQIFNFIFISIYQHILLFLSVSPICIAWLRRDVPLNVVDIISIISFLFFLLGETVSDQQQWNFQQKKLKMMQEQRSGDYLAGFLTHGLFRYSRHPQYFCELMIWLSYYGFSIAASGNRINWTIIGSLLLTGTVLGSISITEEVSTGKYSVYKVYQECTSRLVPWWPKQRSKLESAITMKSSQTPSMQMHFNIHLSI